MPYLAVLMLAVPMHEMLTVPTSSVHVVLRPLGKPPPYCHVRSDTSAKAVPSKVAVMPVLYVATETPVAQANWNSAEPRIASFTVSVTAELLHVAVADTEMPPVIESVPVAF